MSTVATSTVSVVSTSFAYAPVFIGQTLFANAAYYLTCAGPFTGSLNGYWSGVNGVASSSNDLMVLNDGIGLRTGGIWGVPDYNAPAQSIGWNKLSSALAMTITSAPVVPCTACIDGTYLYGNATCSSASPSCAAGFYQTSAATASSTIQCLWCNAGSWSSSGALSCNACMAGTYSSRSGATSSSVCVSCNSGTWSSVQGISSSSQCLSCTAGTWSSVAGASSCITCSAGRWSSVNGASDIAQCRNCAAGTWSSLGGLSSASQCASCQSGTWSALSGASLVSQCNNVTLYAGHYYEIVTQTSSAASSLESAAAARSFRQVSGHLVNIAGLDEQMLVASLIASSSTVGSGALIGGRRAMNAAFEYSSGPEVMLPFTFANWDIISGQPGTTLLNGDCVAMGANGRWLAIDCNSVPPLFVVEYECPSGFEFGFHGCYGLLLDVLHSSHGCQSLTFQMHWSPMLR